MASYKSFEDLPVWQSATDLAAQIFELTGHEAFRFRGDLVNQIRRASLSVSNNIAEGFERGSTADLINFLYIARGSCGETRSMLRFAPKLGGMEVEQDNIDAAATNCESVSRQLYGWIDALKHSGIEGQRKLDDATRGEYAAAELREEYRAKFGGSAADQAIKEGRYSEFLRERQEAQFAIIDAKNGVTEAKAGTEPCPTCGAKMVLRHDRNGRKFWGCSNYPNCRGSRPCA